MNDEAKSKEQLIKELIGLRQRNVELGALEAECKRAEEALQKSEECFRWVAGTTKDIVFRYRFTSPRGFEYISPAVAAITGYTPEEWYADPQLGLKIVRPDDRPRVEKWLQGQGIPERPVMVRWVHKNGAAIWIEQEYMRLYDELGTLLRVEGIARNVTERERLRVLSNRLLQVQEAERRHLARELHDEVGQLLTGLKLALEMSERLPDDAIRASLGEPLSLVSQLLTQVRDLSLDLRPAMLDDLGLLPALLWHFERYTARTHIHVQFEHSGLEKRRFPGRLETAVYRIVQEALTNVARHAKVDEVTVRVWTTQDALNVDIQDEGTGFDPKAMLQGAASGLIGMRERIVLLGGQLTVESSPGVGTHLTAVLPLRRASRKRRKEERR